MSELSFQEFIQADRERLNNERRALTENIAAQQEAIAQIDRDLAAIDAYEAAKTGKTPVPAKSAAPRAPRVSRRKDILQALSHFGSATRRELLTALGAKGDKSAEMSVSNALVALSKTGQVTRDDGRYKLPTIPSAEDVHGALREAAE